MLPAESFRESLGGAVSELESQVDDLCVGTCELPGSHSQSSAPDVFANGYTGQQSESPLEMKDGRMRLLRDLPIDKFSNK